MPPPTNPVEVPSDKDWINVESQFGFDLPEDYKNFIQAYGSGRICKFMWIFNPVSKNENLNLEDQIKLQLDVLSELQEYGEVLPFKLYPEAGGLLPFGVTDNGDVLFWQTIGQPRDWQVIVNEARSPEWAIYHMSMSEFLFKILQKELICDIFPTSFPRDLPIFERP